MAIKKGGDVMGGQRILVVDDEELTCQLLKKRLTAQGYAVSLARSGEEALRKVIEEFPSLILMDIILPDDDGAEVARKIRAKPSLANIPILFLSSIISAEDGPAGSEVRVGDAVHRALGKPVDMKVLLRRIEELLPMKP